MIDFTKKEVDFINELISKHWVYNNTEHKDNKEDFELSLEIVKKLSLYGVSISNRVKMNYLDSKYEVKWLINDVYQVEQDGNCIYQDTETGCNEYLKGLLGY